jgi:flagellin FlaB
MRKYLGSTVASQKGITGLETAIILIAFVVVASVFAFTVLSTGIFSSEKGKETVYAGLQEARSSLEPRGSMIAYKGKTSSDTVYKVSFVVSNAVNGEPIDLTPPFTKNDSGDDPDVSSGAKYVTVVQYQDKNQFLSDVPWTVAFIGDNDGDNLLEDNEKAEITVWLLQRDNLVANATDTNGVKLYSSGGKGITTAANIPAVSGKFTLQVKPPQGSVLTMERTLPPQFDKVMDLR